MGFNGERASSDEIMRTLDDKILPRGPEFLHTLALARESLQISIKIGIKLLAQTAALFWSVEHMFCNFDVGMSLPLRCTYVGLFLLQWLHSVEKHGLENIDAEEKKSFMLLHDLLFEERAPPNEQLLSIRLVALNYREDALCVWGSMRQI